MLLSDSNNFAWIFLSEAPFPPGNGWRTISFFLETDIFWAGELHEKFLTVSLTRKSFVSTFVQIQFLFLQLFVALAWILIIGLWWFYIWIYLQNIHNLAHRVVDTYQIWITNNGPLTQEYFRRQIASVKLTQRNENIDIWKYR